MTTRASSPERDAWIEEARAVSVLRAAEQMGAKLRKATASEYAGPCPVCQGEDRFAVNTAKNVFVCRGSDGAGDAIALVQHVEGCDFLKAVEILTDRPAPEARSETAEEREARARARAARATEAEAAQAEKARDEASFRERERRRCWEFWDRARPIWGNAAEDYLVLRGLRPDLLPPSLPFRFSALHPLFDAPPKGQRARVVHEGPALLAAITRPDGKFAGLQAIWIDLADPDGKARVPDPETGEFLPARKTRGSQMGNRIVLSGPREPRLLFLGEGSETVLSVRQSLLLADALPLEAGFWTGLSLGNLAGRALDRLAHPTERIVRRDGRDGGPRKVPGCVPDFASDAIVIPDSVAELVLLGDGDSEPVLTLLALKRAAARHARRADGSLRQVRLAMSDPGPRLQHPPQESGMILSETDAKAKWCPFARVVAGLNLEDGAREVPALAGVNRDVHSRPIGRCLASDCMAWRHAEPPEFRALADAAYQRDGTRLQSETGFCGLVAWQQ